MGAEYVNKADLNWQVVTVRWLVIALWVEAWTVVGNPLPRRTMLAFMPVAGV